MTELDNKQVNDHQRVEQRGKERSRPQLRDLHLHITGGRGHSLGSLTVALGAATFDALVAAGADFSVASASFNACNPAPDQLGKHRHTFSLVLALSKPHHSKGLTPRRIPTTARGDLLAPDRTLPATESRDTVQRKFFSVNMRIRCLKAGSVIDDQAFNRVMPCAAQYTPLFMAVPRR